MISRRSTFGTAVKVMADFAAGLAAGGLVLLVLVQVAGRLLGRPVPWTEEAVRYLFIWMVFLGLAAGFRTVESARVVVFVAMLRPIFKHITVPIYVGSSVLFFAIMGWTGLSLVRQQIMMNETAATLAIPMWMIGLIMPFSAVIATLAIVKSLRTRRELIALPELGLAAGSVPHPAPGGPLGPSSGQESPR